jgi:hypothetical protein
MNIFRVRIIVFFRLNGELFRPGLTTSQQGHWFSGRTCRNGQGSQNRACLVFGQNCIFHMIYQSFNPFNAGLFLSYIAEPNLPKRLFWLAPGLHLVGNPDKLFSFWSHSMCRLVLQHGIDGDTVLQCLRAVLAVWADHSRTEGVKSQSSWNILTNFHEELANQVWVWVWLIWQR